MFWVPRDFTGRLDRQTDDESVTMSIVLGDAVGCHGNPQQQYLVLDNGGGAGKGALAGM